MFFISQNVFTPTLEDMEVILKQLGDTITITRAQAQKLKNGEAIMMLTWANLPINNQITKMAWYLVTGITFIENGANDAIIYFNNGNADGNDYGIESDSILILG